MAADVQFVGIDLGTSGLKVAILDAGGVLRGESTVEHAVNSPSPGWAESDASAWVHGLRTALAAAFRAAGGHVDAVGAVGAVGIAGQMHGAVVCDGAGHPLRPAVLWPDRRARDDVALWRALPEPVRARLANPLVAGMTGPILRWILDHEPAVAAAADVVLLPKDYLRVALGGPSVTERSDASATLLWDVVDDAWSAATLDGTGLPSRLLPRVVRSDAVVAEASLWHTSAPVPVVAGCSDTAAAMLAAGRLDDRVVHVNLGTGAQVLRRVPGAEARADPPVHLYADEGTGWYAMAAIQNAGLALTWVRDLFALSWRDFFAIAEATPGAGGVSFLPFLTGERGGIAGPGSSGAWIGMSPASGREHLVRAAVQALAFCVRRAVELLDAGGHGIRLTGGVGNPVTTRLLADVLAVTVRQHRVHSASAIGAAILAARGVGVNLEPDPDLGPEIEPRPNEALDDAYRAWAGCLDANAGGP